MQQNIFSLFLSAPIQAKQELQHYNPCFTSMVYVSKHVHIASSHRRGMKHRSIGRFKM
jgi:hypothetical protein